jgi:hypothetical protein
VKVLGAAVALALAAAGASAQDRGHHLFGGYSMLASEGETLHGWQAAAGFRISGRLGLAIDAGGHYGTAGDGSDLSVTSLMAGPRVAFGAGRTRPFLHLLAGAARTEVSVSPFEGVEVSETSTDFGGAAGGGIDIGLGARWAARLAADYRLVAAEDETIGDPRLSAGIVYRFGH